MSRADAVMRRVRAHVTRGLRAESRRTVGAIQRRINTSSRGANPPSQPGEYPHKDTGTHQRSIRFEIKQSATAITSYIGSSNDEYGPFLEFGTDKMEARPHIRPTVAEREDRFRLAVMRGR